MPDIRQLVAALPMLQRALRQRSLLEYCRAVMPAFQSPPHVMALLRLLEQIESGKVRRLIVSAPPRHGKSLSWVLGVSWMLGKHPEWSVACASYGAELSESWGRRVRGILESEAHKSVFPAPGCRLAPDSAAAHRFDLQSGGGGRFVGRGGSILGTGAQLLIADDLYANSEEARSESIKRGCWEWFTETFLTRLEPRGRAVVIGSRFCADDLIARLLSEHPGEWELLSLPAVAGAADPLGRPEGAALWPERYDRAALEKIREAMGSASFLNLYQGAPAAASGVIFQRSWFRIHSGPLPSFQRITLSADTAFGKSAKAGDYSAVSIWGSNNSGHFLLFVWRKRVDFPGLKFHIRQLAEQYKPNCILVEDTGAGTSLVQEFANTVPFPVLPVKATQSKRLRAELCTPLFESGRVWFCEGAWLTDLCDELAIFPVGAHDDQVDSVSMGLNWLREQSYSGGPAIFQTSESSFSVAKLRDYLSGGEARRDVPAALGAKVVNGEALSGAEEWRLLAGLSGWHDEES